MQGLAALLNALADIVGAGGSQQESEATTFEGFTAEQWATWGKRKSGIASSTCRLNGQLKARVTALEGEVLRLHAGEKLQGSEKSPVQESSNSCNGADPLQTDDPWSGVAISVSSSSVKVSNDDVWSKHYWKLKATIGDENGEKRGVQTEYVGGEKTPMPVADKMIVNLTKSEEDEEDLYAQRANVNVFEQKFGGLL